MPDSSARGYDASAASSFVVLSGDLDENRYHLIAREPSGSDDDEYGLVFVIDNLSPTQVAQIRDVCQAAVGS